MIHHESVSLGVSKIRISLIFAIVCHLSRILLKSVKYSLFYSFGIRYNIVFKINFPTFSSYRDGEVPSEKELRSYSEDIFSSKVSHLLSSSPKKLSF